MSLVIPPQGCHDGGVGGHDVAAESIIEALRSAGAIFAFVFGSTAEGRKRPESDIDVGAWWAGAPPAPWDVRVPDGVDLLLLNDAPLELAGRVALRGDLLFDDDPSARVRWQSTIRRIYLDEEDRQQRLDAEFLRSHG